MATRAGGSFCHDRLPRSRVDDDGHRRCQRAEGVLAGLNERGLGWFGQWAKSRVKVGGTTPDVQEMNTDDRQRGRWIGLLLSGALVLGACSSSSGEAAVPAVVDESPDALALDPAAPSTEADVTEADEAADDEAADGEAADASAPFDVAEFTSLADLADVELTPELFEELKTNEVARVAIIDEMGKNGLNVEQSECFLDGVSPGLFIAFGTGEQPSDAQFGELIVLLDTCEIAFGATT